MTNPTKPAEEWGGTHFNHLGGNEKASFLSIATAGIRTSPYPQGAHSHGAGVCGTTSRQYTIITGEHGVVGGNGWEPSAHSYNIQEEQTGFRL